MDDEVGKPSFAQRAAAALAALLQPTKLEAALGRLVAPRMGLWLWISLLLVVAIWFFARHMISVLAWKAACAVLFAFLGDKVARAMESRNARPHELLARAEEVRKASLGLDGMRFAEHLERRADGIYWRRAVVIVGFAIAGSLGS